MTDKMTEYFTRTVGGSTGASRIKYCMENISCNNGNLIGGRPEISQVKMPGLPKDSLHEFFQDQIKMRVNNEMFKKWTSMSNTYGKWLYNLKY